MDSYSSELTGSTAFGISDPLYGSVPLATTAWDLNRTGFSGGRVRNCPGFGVGSWGWWFSGRGGNLLNCLKLDRGEPAEGALTTFAVMGAFHPGDDRQAQFLPGSRSAAGDRTGAVSITPRSCGLVGRWQPCTSQRVGTPGRDCVWVPLSERQPVINGCPRLPN